MKHKVMVRNGAGARPWVMGWKKFTQYFAICSICAITGTATALYYIARCKGAHQNCRIDLHMEEHQLNLGYFLGLLATGVWPLGLVVDLTLHHRMRSEGDDSEEESVPLTPIVVRSGGRASFADEEGGGGGGVVQMVQL